MGKIARRSFLIGAGLVTGGIAFGWYKVQQPYPNPLEDFLADGEHTLNPWLKVAADNTITIIAPRAEMGQGIRTGLAMLVAEELDLELDDVQVEHGPASKAYFNRAMIQLGSPYSREDQSFRAEAARAGLGLVGKMLGLQATGGSTSTIDAFVPMRTAGATAREMFKRAASEELGVREEDLTTSGGFVHAPDGRKVSYGAVAAGAAVLPVPSVKLKDPAEWRILGKSQARVDVPSKVDGTAEFGIDVDLPDLLFGTVRVNPHLGGEMRSFTATEAEKMPGVLKVVDLGNGIGVIAENTWQAFKAAEAVEIEWGDASSPLESKSVEGMMSLVKHEGVGNAFRDDGEIREPTGSESVVKARYSVPFLAHACMEPMNATARIKDRHAEIWTGTQGPGLVEQSVGLRLGAEVDRVTCHTTLLGGGFGRRTETDAAEHAALLALHTNGRPVKLTWTREEDTQHDFYRPAAMADFTGLVGGDGMIQLDARISSPSIMADAMPRYQPGMVYDEPDGLVTEGSHDQPYAIPNYRVVGIEPELEIPLGYWRSVGASFNAFFHESFIDEMAHTAKQDPVAFRLSHLTPSRVAQEVVRKAAEMSGWDTPLPQGRGRGVAFCRSFGSYVAQVVEVSAGEDGILIEKVWCAVDVGTAMNPAAIVMQMEGSINFGLAAAIHQEITFADGTVEQSNFHDYDSLRLRHAPDIEVAILENSTAMGGVGEPGVPPIAPALANAIFAATGKRVRTLPMGKEIDFA